jgi:hypothetical protein
MTEITRREGRTAHNPAGHAAEPDRELPQASGLARMRRFAFALFALLAFPAAAGAATKATEDISPYKRFQFEYTSTKPDTRTGFRYRVALDLPADGSQPPVVQELQLTFAKGTGVDPDAVPACTADDATLTAQGPVACPTRGRIATGTAAVWTGPGPLLGLNSNVFSTSDGVVAVLESNGNVIRVLRGTLHGTKLTVAIPTIEVGPGQQAALVRFSLDISGGSTRRPVFTTPRTCPKGGWPVTYAPLFAQLGRVKLVDVTKCHA